MTDSICLICVRSRRVCVSGFSSRSVAVGQMPLKGAGRPWEKAAQTWTSPLGQEEEVRKSQAGSLRVRRPFPGAVEGSRGDGRTNSPGPCGAVAVCYCQLGGRTSQQGCSGGGGCSKPFLFLLITLFISTLTWSLRAIFISEEKKVF